MEDPRGPKDFNDVLRKALDELNRKQNSLAFEVWDNNTNSTPDLEGIALNEEWAKGLCYCDMEGFAILEDGSLVLLDECGNFAYCPPDRFTVVFERER